jgi:hypothetical protein
MVIPRNETADFSVQNEGTIYLLQPHTDAAREWISEHLTIESWQMFVSALVVEHRYILAIVDGIKADGLEVR